MAKKKKGSWLDKILMGSEKSEGYARASLPSNRWELFWDILKGRFGKLVLINLLMVLFAIPLIAVLVIKNISVVGMGATYPFSQAFGVGYFAPVSITGFAEQIELNSTLIVYLLLPIAFAILAVGLSGGAYIIRNLVWTEGIFVANDFWTGVKKNFKPVILICLIYSVIFYATSLALNFSSFMLAIDKGPRWLIIVCRIMLYAFLIIYSVMSLHMISMSVTYEVKFLSLVKNSFIMTISLLPTNALFIILGAIPFIVLMIGGFLTGIGIILCLLFGLSLFFLVWTDYCQWTYDSFINPRLGFTVNRGIYAKVKESDAASIKQYKEAINITTASSYSSRPIKPITDDELTIEELPESFSREDLERLNASKQRLYEDNEKYIEEHKNDPEFEVFKTENDNKSSEDIEKEKRIAKAKVELSKRNKKKKHGRR